MGRNMKATEYGYNTEYSEDAPTIDEISNMQGHAILEFGTPWCSHCQASQGAVKAVLSEQVKLAHVKVYDGKGKLLGRAFKVKQWPTFILLLNGKEVDRLVRPIDVAQLSKFVSSIAMRT